MIIGVDFDNTLACYDQLFHRLALERGWVTPDSPANKTAVRDTMRANGQEQDWIALQGLAYGSRIGEAPAFDGALAFFKQAYAHGIELFIISHKTRRPVSGDDVDLHHAAAGWLKKQQFIENPLAGLQRSHVFFEETKALKLARIALLACDHFIDDLPEFLAEHAFPARTKKWLFNPSGNYEKATIGDVQTCDSWQALTHALIAQRTEV